MQLSLSSSSLARIRFKVSTQTRPCFYKASEHSYRNDCDNHLLFFAPDVSFQADFGHINSHCNL